MLSVIKLLLLAGLSVIPLSGCDDLKLTRIEKTSQAYKQCLVRQVVPDECQEQERNFQNSLLKARQAGISIDRILASNTLGQNKVADDEKSSPYNRIKTSLESHPYYLPINPQIFLAYKDRCSKSDIENTMRMNSDIIKNEHAFWFRAMGYRQIKNKIVYYFSKTNKPCRPKDPMYIDDKFPIVTTIEIEKLKNGISIPQLPKSVTSAEIKIYDSAFEALNAVKAK